MTCLFQTIKRELSSHSKLESLRHYDFHIFDHIAHHLLHHCGKIECDNLQIFVEKTSRPSISSRYTHSRLNKNDSFSENVFHFMHFMFLTSWNFIRKTYSRLSKCRACTLMIFRVSNCPARSY